MAKRSGPPPQYAPQPISDDDFIDGAIALAHRLSRHMTALENGEPGAVSDVAAVLRTLIARGDGDDVIRRLCKRTGVPLPKVFVTPAAHAGPLVVMSAGGMPGGTDRTDRQGEEFGLLADLNKWSAMTALVVRGAPKRVNDWNHVISMYANTFGSHMSGTIPKTLVETSSVMSGELDVGQYLIFCAGIITENMLSQVLDPLAGASIILPHKTTRKPCTLLHFTVQDPEGNLAIPPIDVTFQVNDLPNIGDSADVLKVTHEQNYFRYWYTRDVDGKIRPKWDHATELPDWWG